MLCALSNLLISLRGNWHLTRQIIQADGSITIAGLAEFKLHELSSLRYRETGVVKHNAKDISFFRDYEFYYSPENKSIAVNFVQQNKVTGLFYQIDSVCGNAHHACGLDTYSISYDFTGLQNDCFRLAFQVTGPNKSYRVTTLFERA